MFKKIALIPVLSLCCMVSAFEISTDFPGGNIEVLEKSNNGAKVAQQIRDTSEWWFYWNFEVSGAAGKTLEFKFANGDPIGSFGPAASYDGGKTWEWLGAGCVKRGKDTSSFKVSIPQNAQSVRFAFCIPYMPADFDALAKETPALQDTQRQGKLLLHPRQSRRKTKNLSNFPPPRLRIHRHIRYGGYFKGICKKWKRRIQPA